MNCIVYNSMKHKLINGTLFYAFEYYVMLRDQGVNLNLVLMNVNSDELSYIIKVFMDKYDFNHKYVDDILGIRSKSALYTQFDLKNVIVLDTLTYKNYHIFMKKAKNILVYSNESHTYLDKNSHTTFYGWYDYQPRHKKTRLKIYGDIHKKYPIKGNKTFVSSLSFDYDKIIDELNLDTDNLLTKSTSKAVDNLFEQIDKLVYYHSRLDSNNRLLVESYIHGIETEVHLNGFVNDSVKERDELIRSGNGDDLLLTKDDLMIQDFIKVCNE